MAHAVQEAIAKDEHLLVQAGTGTGKSLAYLIPAVMHAIDSGKPAVVATATLALQAQIVDRDMPRLAEAIAPLIGRRPTYGLVKGRRNYLCAHKLEGGFPDDDADSLMSVGQVDQQASRLGAEVVRLREWAEVTESGDRDELVPGVSERAWRQVSVSAHECLGGKCPMVTECFVERSREAAKDVDVIVTNHSFMAIDSFEGRQMLPEHDLLVIDEAHELVDRVTSTVTDEITASMVSAAARRAGRLAESTEAVEDAAVFLQGVLDELPEGRLVGIPDALELALARVRDTTRQVQSELAGAGRGGRRHPPGGPGRHRRDVREQRPCPRAPRPRRRMGQPRPPARLRAAGGADERRDAVAGQGLRRPDRGDDVGDVELGGTFDAVAGTLGLRGEGAPDWQGLDVGSPFDYPKQAIAYVAKHLPPPGRDGLSEQTLDEIEALVRAAGGRALGLFSSMRAARGRPTPCASASRGTSASSARARTRSPRSCGSSRETRRPASSGLSPSGRGSTSPARPASSSSSTASRSHGPMTRCPRPGRRPSRGWAATASWRSRPPTPRCVSRRARDASSGRGPTASSSPSSTP